MIKLYHGSNQKIEVPDLVHSKPFKDFGRGFYLSANKQQALDMAFQKVSQTQLGNAEVTEFLFDETAMQSPDLKVLTYPDYCEEWALFVLKNRRLWSHCRRRCHLPVAPIRRRSHLPAATGRGTEVRQGHHLPVLLRHRACP